jgi:uncharacterized protein (DUF305 family)
MRHMMRPAAALGLLAAVSVGACGKAIQQSTSTISPAGAPASGPATTPSTPAERAAANASRPRYTTADVHFISGMIGHHAQAVVMAGWAPTHGASASVRTLCERIAVAQTDEIKFMQRWLQERHEPVPPADPNGHMMPGMDHPMLMPGMLTPEQMKQLDGARGSEFDRLFLTFMIQHHQGAISMVEQLMGSYGAAQDDAVFKFASDVNADQTTEIDRMNLMLNAMASGTRSP